MALTTYSDNFRPKQIYGTFSFLYSLIDITVASCNKNGGKRKEQVGFLGFFDDDQTRVYI